MKFGIVLLLLFVRAYSLPKNKKFDLHLERVRAFQCREPQKRAFKVVDIVNAGLVGKAFVPHMTVLHRCDKNAGCCQNDDRFTCGPAEVETVSLTFHVTYIIASGGIKKGTVLFDTIPALNHTRCSCIDAGEDPR